MKENELFEKYDLLGPRYTSYPPVPFWVGPPTEDEWWRQWQQALPRHQNQVALYVHIPFCQKICRYCGLNRQEAENGPIVDQYLQTMLKEWSLYKNKLDPLTLKVLHLGGGTPTFLSIVQMDFFLRELFANTTEVTSSLEADPRSCSKEKLQLLHNYGFRRLSLGVQDLNPEIQQIIGREQSFALVKEVVEDARKIGFQEINFDLIYGLPGQRHEHIEHTFEMVARLRPDTIAFYSFAYIPHFSSNQQGLETYPIPQGKSKRELYQVGRQILFAQGLHEIGLDHFALPGSSLDKAQREKRLHRSFMGYTEQLSPLLIAIGTSSISSNSFSYVQNNKEIGAYREALENNRLAFNKGHVLTAEDQKVQKIIQDIMCFGEATIDFFPEELREMEKDQMVILSEKKIRVTERGRPFLRNIAMLFDFRMNQGQKNIQFSRTI
jgi:oxygen-independent coproporphyrinogen III oxidase